MFDLKVINSVLEQLQEERGIPKEKIIEAIEAALATAYKKEYGKKGQIVRATFNLNTGATEFSQVKIVVDETKVIFENTEAEENQKSEKVSKSKKTKADAEETATPVNPDDEFKVHFNPEHHILLANAQKIKKDAKIDDEIVFPLEVKGDYGRIASQTAKQVIIQKIREAEKVSVLGEYGKREGEIVSGTVQRLERGNIFLDMGRTTAILPYEEQIPGERYRQGERVHAILLKVEDGARGVFIKLSRSHPKFLEKLFAQEAPEVVGGTVEIKGVVREAGSRSKVAAFSNDEHVDPVGSLVGQRGVRVSTVMSELGGEKIDIIEWSADPKKYIEESLSPAKVQNVEIDEAEHKAVVTVDEDQQSLAIGKGGQNVRLAAKLTGWRIDIQSTKPERVETEKTEEEEIDPAVKDSGQE
jgi:N utilization substance protein A